MKKCIALLTVIGIFSLESCTINEVDTAVDDNIIPQAFEIKNIDFRYNTADGFYIYNTFQREFGSDLYNEETVLIYRLTGVINSSTPIWQLIPRTIYLSSGREIDYDFDFSKKDFTIYARGNYDLELTPDFLDNQTFRIVILPSNLVSSLNTTNYVEVMKTINLKESQVKHMNL